MTDDRRPDQEHALDAFWNALVRGEDRPDAAALDPATAGQLIRAQSLIRTQPPAGAEERLRANVMAELARRRTHSNGKAHPMNGTAALNGPYAPYRPNGRARPTPVIPLRSPGRRALHRGLSFLGAAALLIALLSGLFVFYQATDDHALIPANQTTATPPASPTVQWQSFGGNAARDRVMPGPGPKGNPTLLWSYPPSGTDPIAASLDRGAMADGALYVPADGLILALDAKTGAELWRAPGFGNVAVVDGDGLIVQILDPNKTPDDPTGLARIRRSDGSLVWQAEAGQIQPSWNPVVENGVGYVPSGSDVIAFDAATGKILWRLPLQAPASRGAAVNNGLLVLGDEQGTIYGVTTNGDIAWTYDTDATLIGHPAIANGIAYAFAPSDTENAFVALDTATGKLKWRFVSPDNAAFRGPAADGTTVYVGTVTDTLYALDAQTGAIRWQMKPGGTFIQGPVLVDGTLYTSAGEIPGAVYAIDPATGALRWQLPIGGQTSSGAIVVDGVIYVSTDGGAMYAIGGDGAAALASPVATSSPSQSSATGTSAQQAQFLWSANGDATNRLDHVLGVRLSPDGHLWVSDVSSRFFIFDLDGNLTDVWGSKGSGPGQFSFSTLEFEVGIVEFQPDGAFYVLDPFNYRVQRFDRDRSYLGEWGSNGKGDGQFVRPFGIAREPDGNVLVSDYGRDDIQRFSPDGVYIGKFDASSTPDGKLVGPSGIAVDADGRIYVTETDANRVRIFDHDGNQLGVLGAGGPDFGGFDYPGEAVPGPDGYVYVADSFNCRIVVFDADWHYAFQWGEAGTGDGQFKSTGNIAINRGGTVYVSDWYGGRIEKFKITGDFPPLAVDPATPTA